MHVDGGTITGALGYGQLFNQKTVKTDRKVPCHFYVIRNGKLDAEYKQVPRKCMGIGTAAAEGFVGIYIKDNGPGIPPEERERIFQKFYQIEESFTGQVEGAGLGLALVKRIIEAHGGKVVLDSVIGSGSTFSLLFPVRQNCA